MTDLENKILETVKMGDGRGDIPKLVYYRYLRRLEESGMSMDQAMDSISAAQVEKAMDSLCEQGYLEKQSNWNGTEMLYYVKKVEPAAQGNLMGRSNFFATVEEAYARCTQEQLEYEALNVATTIVKEVFAKMSNANQILVPILFLGAKLACAGDGELSQEEKNLADKVFGKVLSNPEMSGIYNSISAAITDEDYNLVSIITQMGHGIAMPFLKYIFCFAYIDGKFEDEVAKKLDGLFGQVLLREYFNQTGE